MKCPFYSKRLKDCEVSFAMCGEYWSWYALHIEDKDPARPPQKINTKGIE